MTVYLVDNYDSFTYNLLHYLCELGSKVEVYRNDQLSADDVIAAKPRAIVISPGPGTPDDAGICMELIAKAAATQIPLLGVCLGHQSIGQLYGGKIIRHLPMHGKTDDIIHTGQGVFRGLPNPFTATRYHSLIVERESLPDCLEITAETNDGIIMGLQHRDYELHGVQFHPESIASEQGHELLKNFLDNVAEL